MADRIGAITFFDDFVMPLILADPRGILPEFDFRPCKAGWEAGPQATDQVREYFRARPDRIFLSSKQPGMFGIAGSNETFQLTAYILGTTTPPKGPEFKAAVIKLGKLAGVDTSPIDGAQLTPERMREIKAEQAERSKQAAEDLERVKEQQRIEDQRAIANARNLIGRASEYTHRHGGDLIKKYFSRRGINLDEVPGVEIGKTLFVVGDAIHPGKNQLAVVVPMFLGREIVAAQRLFIDDKGHPVEVVLKDKPTRKGIIGRPRGAHAIIGSITETKEVYITEGYETGVAVALATGSMVLPAYSAAGIETIELPELIIKNKSDLGVIIAGDLDVSETGQKSALFAADRIRCEYGIKSIHALPEYPHFESLVNKDQMPVDGKSVDWEDVVKSEGAELVGDFLADVANQAHITPSQDHSTPPSSAEEMATETRRKPNHVLPPNDLDRAHLFLRHRFMLEDAEALSLISMGGRIYYYRDGRYIELGEQSVIRAEIRRWSRPFFVKKSKKDSDNNWDVWWELANLSKTGINAILEAAVDEVLVTTPVDDFQTQFFLSPNVDRGEVLWDTPAWERRIEDPKRSGLPEPGMVLSIDNGLLNLESWRDVCQLELMNHTPGFFSTTKLDVELDMASVHDAIENDQVEALRTYAESLCPEWIKFLRWTFEDPEDPSSFTEHCREIHKLIGNYLTGELGHHNGNIAWLHGPSGSGKSTLAKVITILLGERNTVSSSLFKLASQFELSGWIGKLLAIFPDLDQSAKSDAKANVEIFKMIATGDAIGVDRKHRDPIPSHVFRTRILCIVNQMPRLPDSSNSLMRRSIVFDFKRVPTPEQRDRELLSKLSTQQSLAGILLLAICGIQDLIEDDGFRQPKGSMMPLEALADQGSPYPEFIEHCIKIDNEWSQSDDVVPYVPTEQLHEAFIGYLDSIGTRRPPLRSDFIAELLPVLVSRQWKSSCRYRPSVGGKKQPPGYRGLQLTDFGHQMMAAAQGDQSPPIDNGASGSGGFFSNTSPSPS